MVCRRFRNQRDDECHDELGGCGVVPNAATARRCAGTRATTCHSKRTADQKVYAVLFSCQFVRSGARSLSVLYLRCCHGSHWGGTWGRSFSVGSWGHSLRQRCIERSGKCGPVFGRIPGRGFRMGWVAESATRKIAPKRDAVALMGLKRKARPIPELQNGMHFPRGSIAATEQRASFVTRPVPASRALPACPPRSRRRRLPALRGRGSPS